MKKRTKIFVLIAAVLAVATAIDIFALGGRAEPTRLLGTQYQDAETDTSGKVLAVYRGEPVTAAALKYRQSAAQDGMTAPAESERALLDQLLADRILAEEARAHGLYPTQAEVDANVAVLQKSYAQFPEASEPIDTFCKSAGLTIDEYWALVEQQLFASIALDREWKRFETEYRAQSGGGRDLSDAAYAEEVQSAYDAYRAELLEQHAADIVYYMPVEK